ncbi:hypothetical protein LINPERHAP1_LOCUS27351, partial [Linum perenne]
MVKEKSSTGDDTKRNRETKVKSQKTRRKTITFRGKSKRKQKQRTILHREKYFSSESPLPSDDSQKEKKFGSSKNRRQTETKYSLSSPVFLLLR